jgi:hypothetical protein
VASLLHIIQTADNFPHPVSFIWFFKANGLEHELCFIIREQTIEECHLDINLLGIPALSVPPDAVRFARIPLGRGRCSLVIIAPRDLFEATEH